MHRFGWCISWRALIHLVQYNQIGLVYMATKLRHLGSPIARRCIENQNHHIGMLRRIERTADAFRLNRASRVTDTSGI